MPSAPVYRIGEPLSPEEAQGALDVLVPPQHKSKFARTPERVIAAFMAHVPLLWEHQVNKLRGWAFDIGESGFTYERGT